MRIYYVSRKSRYHKHQDYVVAAFSDKEKAKRYKRQAEKNSFYDYKLHDVEVDPDYKQHPTHLTAYSFGEWVSQEQNSKRDEPIWSSAVSWEEYDRPANPEEVYFSKSSYNYGNGSEANKGTLRVYIQSTDEETAGKIAREKFDEWRANNADKL